ncbi:MAG: OsmC family protein [Spirochaetota bacterium]
MPIRKSNAVWEGKIKEGKGTMKLGSGAFQGNFSFASRFENGKGTNPEELIGAAHAGCFSMAFSLMLEEEGFEPKSINTDASVSIEQKGGAFAITTIKLSTEADIPGIDKEKFLQIAEKAKGNCPVSKALQGVDISLEAKLK